MAEPERYELNYDWSRLGPAQWTELSTVTLQIDLESFAEPDALWDGMDGWWNRQTKDPNKPVTYAGGCWMPRPVRTEGRLTMWLCSRGEDAFDSIHHYAQDVYRVATQADPEVRIVWTELPHRDAGDET